MKEMKKLLLKIIILFIILLFFSLCLSNTVYGWTITRDQCDLDHCGAPLDVRTHWPGNTCASEPPDNLHTVCCYERIRDPETDWGFSSSRWCAPPGVVNTKTCNQDQCVETPEGFECSIPGCVPDVEVTATVNICRGCIPEVLSPKASPSTPEDTITILKPQCCNIRTGAPANCEILDKSPRLREYTGIQTALGCFPTKPRAIISWILKYAIILGGGIAFLLMLYGAFQIIISAGDPEKLKEGQQILGSAIGGLLFVIFAIFLLRLIGFTILRIPGWG